jgi:hypothetical protein
VINYDICVARYNENLYWLKDYAKNVVVYNKTDNLNNLGFKKVINIEPIGLETYSFFSYIIDYYENLPDVVVFVQGKIEDHLGADNHRHSANDKKNVSVYLTVLDWAKRAHNSDAQKAKDEKETITHFGIAANRLG